MISDSTRALSAERVCVVVGLAGVVVEGAASASGQRLDASIIIAQIPAINER